MTQRFAADVLCLGETMALVAPAVPEPLESAGECTITAGGAESNVAIQLAALGHSVRWASRVGDDPLGHRVIGTIASAGVDTSLVELSTTAPTGVYFKDPGRCGSRVYYYRSGSAASTMDDGFLGAEVLESVAMVHLSGITPALSASCDRLVRSLLRSGRSYRVSFDVNYRPTLWDVQRAAPVLRELAQLADVVFVGLDEARTLWGVDDAEDVRAVLDAPPTVVVKDADVAAYALGAGAAVVDAPRVRVVEPVGAGDAFAAGYLAGQLRGEGGKRCLRRGHILAAHSLLSTGDHTRLPDGTALDRWLDLDDAQWRELTFAGEIDPGARPNPVR